MKLWKMFMISMVLVVGMVIGMAMADKPGKQWQPQMKAALKNLESAKTNLKKATADKGGHRVKAIALIDEAINQVKMGIEFDNKNP